MRTNSLKTAWRSEEATLGLWLSAADPVTTELMASVDYDYFCLDMQHGLIDYVHAVPALQAMRSSKGIPLARAPWNEPGSIGKLLDAGAMGIIIPMVNTVTEAEQAVSACRYAPAGSRSYGPGRAAPVLGPSYFEEANEEIACIPMIETEAAVENLEDIIKVQGIDAIYVGPSDLGISLGLGPGADNDAQVFADAIAHIVAVCHDNGIAPGIHSVPTLVGKRLAQGFRMVTVTSDTAAATDGARRALDVARDELSADRRSSMY